MFSLDSKFYKYYNTDTRDYNALTHSSLHFLWPDVRKRMIRDCWWFRYVLTPWREVPLDVDT